MNINRETIRLTKIELEGIYGFLNHIIELNLEERITILTAPNGCGKTTVLEIVYYLLKQEPIFFNYLNFKKITCCFDNNSVIELEKKFTKSEINIDVFLIKEYEQLRRHDKWNKIVEYAIELSNIVKETINEYTQVSQSLDSSFVKRVFQKKTKQVENLIERLTALQEKRKKIARYGLLKLEKDSDIKPHECIGITDNDVLLLSTYITDNEKKLAVLNSLIERIELFVDILNNRRFHFKKIEFNKETGFNFKAETDSDLLFSKLSSGEQHEVISLFELLFKAKENSLVLIDEPEKSLHINWQKNFLDDIEKIIKLRKLDVIIATHSPQIINDRWDLTRELTCK